jgi:hypothetical protein
MTHGFGSGAADPAAPNSLLGILFFVEDLLEAHEIEHWLDWGTLLGAVRTGELIPWDWDGDLGVLAGDMEILLQLAPEVEEAGHVLESRKAGLRVRKGTAEGAWVDLYVWQEQNGLLTPQVSLEDLWPGMVGRERFPPSYLEKPTSVVLHGRRFPAPSPVDRFLAEHRYGPDFMTPRRPILNTRLYGGSISFEDLTSSANELLRRIGDAEHRLAELSPWSRSQARLKVRWWAGGLPVAADEERVLRIRASIPNGKVSPLVDRLVTSLALLEQAIDEAECPKPGAVARGAYRRAVRMWEVVASSLARRQRRRGFPYEPSGS